MGSEPTDPRTGAREPMEIEERGYNPPPVAKVERPAPPPPAPPAPRPWSPTSGPKEHSQ